MTDMIDRVARAMYDNRAKELQLREGWEAFQHSPGAAIWRRQARAAIQAMREPTEAMIQAGERVPGYPGFCDEPAEPPDRDDIYRAMIDAALQEKLDV